MDPTKTLKSSTRLQARFIRDLNKAPDLRDVLGELVKETRELLDAGTCTVFLIDPDRRRATQVASSGYQEEHTGKNDVGVVPPAGVSERPAPGEELGLTGWMLSTGMPLLASSPEEVRNHPHHAARPQAADGDILLRTFLGVPFRGLYGEVIGVIKAERRLPEKETSGPVEPFSPEDQLVLETMARVAARCVIYLDMARNNPNADVATAWSRDVIAEAAASEGELDSFLHTAANVAAAAVGAESCGIFLRDETGQTLTQRAGTGSQALRKVIRSYPWPEPAKIQTCSDPAVCCPPNCPSHCRGPVGERVGLTAWIAATGKSFHARNFDELRQHCHHRGQFDPVNFLEGEVCGAFLGIPLRVGGAVIGAIKVENRAKLGEIDERDFPEEAQRRFRIIAEEIALSMRRLQAQIPVRYDIIEKAKATIFKILRGGLGIQDLARTVVEETSALFNAGACALFLKQGDELVQPRWAAAGWAQRGPDVRVYKLVDRRAIKPKPVTKEDKVGLTVWIASMQEKFKARSHQELTMHPHHRGEYDSVNFLGPDRCESFMGAPLVIRQGAETDLVGVLKVETKRRGEGDDKTFTYFSELDEIVFDLIVNSAAVAIQNARLRESEARATENAWRQFTAMAAHRISGETETSGSALSILRGMLATSPDAANTIVQLNTMDDALRRIDNLVEEFTEFTKPRMHSVAAVDVNKLCREAAAGRAGMHIHLDLADALPTWWGDEEDLHYCLKEMVLNAAKELKSGGNLTIVTRALHDNSWIRIELIDDGRGVKPEYKERIFERAFRDRKGGTGLGLAIVRGIIEQYRGRVWEQGTYQKGAHFIIHLPVPTRVIDAPKHILLVEDNDTSREAFRTGIVSGGPDREVHVARNEEEAAHLLDERAFDLIITDINLRDGGGSETGGIKVMERARATGRNTPIIVVTGYGKIELTGSDDPNSLRISVEDRARQLGCEAFLPRNRNTRDVLVTTVNRVFETPGSRAGVQHAAAPGGGQ